MLKRTLFFVGIALIANACAENTPSKEPVTEPKEIVQESVEKPTPISRIEKAHEKEKFLSHEAVQFDLLLKFGGKTRVDGQLTLSTDSRFGLLTMNNGDSILYRNDTIFYSPSITKPARARFNAYTWSYFFLFPYKLSDPGTIWSETTTDSLLETQYNRQKLTFESGTGDAPDDWYIVYSAPESQKIEVAAYIVTANKSKEKAEADPHAIQYGQYESVDGVPFAKKWVFWEWREMEGLTRELGNGELSNVKFITPDVSAFVPPTHFKLGTSK